VVQADKPKHWLPLHLSPGGTYGSESGTSFSAPIITGIAALTASALGAASGNYYLAQQVRIWGCVSTSGLELKPSGVDMHLSTMGLKPIAMTAVHCDCCLAQQILKTSRLVHPWVPGTWACTTAGVLCGGGSYQSRMQHVPHARCPLPSPAAAIDCAPAAACVLTPSPVQTKGLIMSSAPQYPSLRCVTGGRGSAVGSVAAALAAAANGTGSSGMGADTGVHTSVENSSLAIKL
jgi:subtilisin family serine protease